MLDITPDFEVRIAHKVLAEIDGPMLEHGLQEMHGRPIQLPKRRADQPNPDLLAWRYERFEIHPQLMD